MQALQSRETPNIVLLGSWASATLLLLLVRFEFQRKVNETKFSVPREWMMVVIECKECVVHFRANSNESIGYGNYTYGHNLQPTDSRFWNPTVPVFRPVPNDSIRVVQQCPLQLLCNVRNKNSLRHTVQHMSSGRSFAWLLEERVHKLNATINKSRVTCTGWQAGQEGRQVFRKSESKFFDILMLNAERTNHSLTVTLLFYIASLNWTKDED